MLLAPDPANLIIGGDGPRPSRFRSAEIERAGRLAGGRLRKASRRGGTIFPGVLLAETGRAPNVLDQAKPSKTIMDKPRNAPVTQQPKADDVAAFVDAARRTPAPTAGTRGRLIFALDATMSRQPTWDSAQRLQAKMFDAAARSGGLDVQLVYYRGLGECKASRFVSEGRGLAELMSRIEVRGGETQIRRVLAHARDEAKRAKVGALVFVGDAMEENPDALAALAGELALQGVKAFMFQEGRDPSARRVFSEIARLTGGVYSAFDSGASARLESLLRAAAAYAAGGQKALALEAESDATARLLLSQMRGS